MTSDGPTTSGIAAALAVSVVLLGGCGSANDQQAPESQAPTLASTAAIYTDPYALACVHVKNIPAEPA